MLKDFDDHFNLDYVCGVDEVGRGSLAGPVVSAAAILKKDFNYNDLIDVNDSKKISPKKRSIIYNKILENMFIGIGIVEPEEIDRINILNATLKSMYRAVSDLKIKSKIDIILVDGNTLIPKIEILQKAIIKGDSTSLAIAAASIVAKCVRDKIMENYSKDYPKYKFSSNKGYGTKDHLDAIKEFGCSKIHRKSFIKKYID